MSNRSQIVKKTLICFLLVSPSAAMVWGQQRDVSAKLGYPDLIIYNAKIVTMDDPSFQSKVGTITQATAVRGDRILATGTNAEMRALAGPQTKQIDLKGRTVLPSFIMTHEHPTDWAFLEPEALKHVLPENNDLMIVRWLKAAPVQEQFLELQQVMKEAVTKTKPGQWILINFNWGSEYEYAEEIMQRFHRLVTKKLLDTLAPKTPVKVKNGFVTAVINSKALEELEKVHDRLSVFQHATTMDKVKQYEEDGLNFSWPIEPDVIFKDRTALLADILKAEMELWVAHGITAFASSPYTYHNFQALSFLDKRGEMPARFGWSYRGPDFHIDTLRIIVGLLGQGSDYLWNIGVRPADGTNCRTMDARPEVKAQEQCSLAPGSFGREVLESSIKAGARLVTIHSEGDKDIDYLMDAIEKASKEAGMSLEEIRAKRHAFDHGGGAPRPDQLPRIKNLGMMVSLTNTYLWERAGRNYDAYMIARDYGIEYTTWVVPRKSMTEAGILNSFEIDRPMPQKLFFFIHKGITRYNEREQKVYGAKERTDRIVQLKALTTWASYYMLKEKLMGSLEAGKFADFIVLDQDYLTIPEDAIPKTRVLMTVVGGKMAHLLPSLAQEIGMQPVGPVTWKTKPLENYYAQGRP